MLSLLALSDDILRSILEQLDTPRAAPVDADDPTDRRMDAPSWMPDEVRLVSRSRQYLVSVSV